ncbi:hypothetical protein [Oryzomonas rubra]|uniref:Uncharacterized protein n=1 Tax=Oryzomonas rubra TaxID=2509454 RepID=A0A5A9XKP4_9BACT|nr:hypothetical protein [Oryzomonas rubra]KAA0893484.1 hypothetical protein ET418_06670 [Oryzomonas rubra]
MATKKLAAGDCIEARCTRCRAVLNHTIVAMVGEKIIRVECNTCRGMHNYRGEKTTKEPAARTTRTAAAAAPRKARKDPGAAEREEWESLSPAMEPGRALPYDMNGKFRVNSLVAHPVFGLGVVKVVVTPNKMQVLFQDGKKLLRCG